jgi:hypothetical protein
MKQASKVHQTRMGESVRPFPPPPDALLRACRRLLRPLVRLLIQAGVTFPVLAELVRTLFVEVAVRDVLVDRRASTDSRVSLITGVHRKEIRRLRQLPADADPIPAAVTVGSQVIARWVALPEYTDGEGKPLPLPRSAPVGGGPSFDTLVESVTTDVRPRAVLDDWVSQGLVILDGPDMVHLNTSAFIPRGGGSEQMFYFGRNLHDHIAVASANVSAGGGPAPFIDRAVHYDGLDEVSARALEQIAREASQSCLLEVNRAALALVEAMPEGSGAGGTNRARVNFGVYVYRDEESTEEPPRS